VKIPKNLPIIIFISAFCIYLCLTLLLPVFSIKMFSNLLDSDIKYDSFLTLATSSKIHNIDIRSRSDEKQTIKASQAKINISGPFAVLFSGNFRIVVNVSELTLPKDLPIIETLSSIFNNHEDFIKNCTTADSVFCDMIIKGKKITINNLQIITKNINWELNGTIDVNNNNISISGKLTFSEGLAGNLSEEVKKMLAGNSLSLRIFGKLSSPNIIVENPRIELNFREIQIK